MPQNAHTPLIASMHRAWRWAILPAALAVAMSGCKKPVDDATLTTQVQAAITSDAVIGKQPIAISVSQAVVTLTGNVTDDTASALAANDAAKVPGVAKVVNALTIAGVAVAPTITETAPSSSGSPASLQPRPTTPQERAAIASNQPLPPPPPAAPPAPVIRTVHIHTGTVIPIRITETLSSATTQTGTPFHGVTTHEVDADGLLAIPAGSAVTGTVTEAKDATHFAGSSLLSVTLNTVRVRGERITIATDAYTVEGKGRGKNTAEKVGGGAAVGAILGGIFGGGKGAAIGAAAGGGGGAVWQGTTRGQQVSIPSETLLRFHTVEPIAVRTAELPYLDQNKETEPPAEPTLQPRD